MIILDSTAQSLQIVLSGAVTTNQLDYTSSFAEFVSATTTSYTPGSDSGATNDTTAVTIVSPPSASNTRVVKHFTVYNNDTVAATVTVQKLITATVRVLCKVTLQPSYTLQYADGEGFSVIDSVGGDIIRSPNLSPGVSAGTQFGSTGSVIFSNSNGISFGLSGSQTLTGSISRLSQIYFEAFHRNLEPNAAATNSGAINLSLQRVYIPYDITATRLDLIAHLTVAGSTNGTWSISAGVYTRSGSILASASTTQSGFTWNSGGATTDTNSYSGVSGTRVRSLAPANWAFTPGEYWFGFINSVQGPAGTTGSVTIYGQSSVSLNALPGAQSNASGQTNDVIGVAGMYSRATNAFPQYIQLSEINWGSNNAASDLRQPYFKMFGSY